MTKSKDPVCNNDSALPKLGDVFDMPAIREAASAYIKEAGEAGLIEFRLLMLKVLVLLAEESGHESVPITILKKALEERTE